MSLPKTILRPRRWPPQEASQVWDPAEVLRVLLSEEAQGRDIATREMRRKAPRCRPARRSSRGARRIHRSRW